MYFRFGEKSRAAGASPLVPEIFRKIPELSLNGRETLPGLKGGNSARAKRG
jgi:hypothetical protein